MAVANRRQGRRKVTRPLIDDVSRRARCQLLITCRHAIVSCLFSKNGIVSNPWFLVNANVDLLDLTNNTCMAVYCRGQELYVGLLCCAANITTVFNVVDNSQKLLLSLEDLHPHPTHGSLGSPNSLVGFLENVHVRGILGYKLGTRLFNIIQVCWFR